MLKTIMRSIANSCAAPSGGACSAPDKNVGCSKNSKPANDILRSYEKQATHPIKMPLKCSQVVKDQFMIVAELEKQNYYVDALQEVNKALCFAPTDTDSVALLYASRATILGEMQLYAEAVESTKLALEGRISTCKRGEILSMQKELAQKACGRKRAEDNLFRVTLSHPACPRNPSVIKDMHVERNCQYGRHLIADRDLEVGDVICVEVAYVKCIQPEQVYKRCTHCLEEAPHLLMPCPKCTSAMFCSEECQEDAWDTYHKHECAISEELLVLDEDVSRLAMRTFLTVIHLFDGDIATLQRFLEQNKHRKISAFDLDHSALCKKEQFLAYYNGNCSDSQLSECTKAAKMKESAKLASLLGRRTCSFAGQLECDKLKVFLVKFFYHLICVNTNNSYETGSPSMVPQKVPTCLGLFLCMSMASHACSGNVARLRVNGLDQMWVVTHFIPSGAQIFDNYGAFFMNQRREERQARLKDHYGFTCACEACRLNYPMAKDLCAPSNVPWPGISYLSGNSPATVAKLKAELHAIREYVAKYDEYFPCQQLREAEIRLVHLFRVAAKDETLETKYPEFTAPPGAKSCLIERAKDFDEEGSD